LVRIPYLGKYHIRASFTDITNRKTLEEALHQSNRYNRSLFEAAVDPLTTIGPDGRITDVNAATELMTGYSRHEMIGLDFTTFFSNPRLAHEGFLQVFQDSKIRDYPLEIRHRDGHYTPVLYNATVFRNEEGTIAGVFAAARDVSEQIRINESFRDIEGRFFTVFENSPIGMAILSSSGRCMRVNHALCSLLGYTDEELAIIPFTIYTHPEDLDENVRQFEAVNAGIIDSYILEKRYVRKSGEIIWVQLNVSSVPDKNGVFSYCIAQILDITWRKEGGQGIGSKSQERIP
jgi:PAS domain S-box-containing protein